MNLLACVMSKGRVNSDDSWRFLGVWNLTLDPLQSIGSKLLVRPRALGHEVMQAVVIRVKHQPLVDVS